MFRIAVILAVSLCAATASAQQWAEKMFAERGHDFGAVPRSAKVEFPFVVTNLYDAEVHIASVHASCGCTQPRIVNDTLKPNEQGSIIAEFNTRAFTGQHSARVTVTIDRPQFAQVVLDVRGYIRTDIVLDPGQVNLGSVATGQSAAKKIRINHAGRSDWQITGVSSNSPFLTATVAEISRTADRVSYELDVQLKEGAPAGYLKDQLQVTTNDRRAQFPVIVEGLIVSELTVSPSALMLGTLQPGQKVTKQIVVKGIKPFKVVDVHCDNPAFTFQAPQDEAKIVHLVPVTFEAGSNVGKVNAKIEIVTDLAEHNTAELSVIGQITAPFAGK